MRSVRGSSPKMASDTVTEPDFLPSSDVTFSSMSRTPRVLTDHDRGRRFIVGELELAGLRHAVRQLLLHRVAHRDPAALDAGHRAFDQDEAALDVGLHDLEVERGHPVDAEMTGHFLVLEGLAGVLAAAGRADRAVRDRHAVARPQPGEIPARHPVPLCEHSGTHCLFLRALELDLDVDTGGEVELHQRIDGLRRRIDDIEQAFMGAHFELLAALFVDMRRAVDGELLDLGRQRDRPAHLRAGALRRIDDLARRRIEDAVIERLESASYVLTVHCRSLFPREWRIA